MAALASAKVDEIRRLAADGVTAYRIAKMVGCSPASVHKYAPAGSFDRSTTMAATKARQADISARRAELAALMLEDAHRLREQIWQPTKIYSFGGKDNTYNEKQVDEPPFDAKRNLVQAVSTLVTAHLRLVDHDSDGGLDEAQSVLDGFMNAVARRAAELDDGDG